MSAFISNEELIFYTQIMFPDARPGPDYTVRCTYDAQTLEPLDDAVFATWNLTTPKPAKTKIAELKALYDYAGWQKGDALRLERGRRLLKADILVARAEDQGDEAAEKAARAYRQALRDVPQQKDFPGRVEWPDPPSALPSDYPKEKPA